MIAPLHDNVLLEVWDGPETSKGGIVLPSKARESNQRDAKQGKVLAVGPGRASEYGPFMVTGVDVGDVVLFPRHAGIEVNDDGTVLRIIRGCELIGKVEQRRIVEVV